MDLVFNFPPHSCQDLLGPEEHALRKLPLGSVHFLIFVLGQECFLHLWWWLFGWLFGCRGRAGCGVLAPVLAWLMGCSPGTAGHIADLPQVSDLCFRKSHSSAATRGVTPSWAYPSSSGFTNSSSTSSQLLAIAPIRRRWTMPVSPADSPGRLYPLLPPRPVSRGLDSGPHGVLPPGAWSTN